MTIQDVIEAKRDGRKHTREEIQFLVASASDGGAEDYQLAAWLMAAYIHPLDAEETAWLTLAMADSGERLDLTGLPKPWLDKHSTGGVGDTTSLVALPMLAACGITVAKMSGRGLGITGGTIDKLSSIPGFRTDLSPEDMLSQAREVGIALTGQTPSLAPADKAFYALRDATATIGSIPLIVSSILCKKLAGGAETIVLDVKAGSGAFMPSIERAKVLAQALKQTADLCGMNVRLLVTDMDQPLGRAVGNALEVAEAAETLGGRIDTRLGRLCVELVGTALCACGRAADLEAGRILAREALVSGRAQKKAADWVAAQGGDVRAVFDPWSVLPRAPVRRIMANEAGEGWIQRLDAGIVGETVLALGGGRRRKEDEVDARVGIEVHTQLGDRVEQGQPLLTVHASDEGSARSALSALSAAIAVAPEPIDAPDLVFARL